MMMTMMIMLIMMMMTIILMVQASPHKERVQASHLIHTASSDHWPMMMTMVMILTMLVVMINEHDVARKRVNCILT